MHRSLKSLEALVGKHALKADEQSVLVFDWSSIAPKRQEAFLAELFADWDGENSPLFSSLVTRERQGRRHSVRWSNDRLLPFALAGVDSSTKRWVFDGGSSFPQFNDLLIADLEARGTPVFALEVDGGAVDTGKLTRVGLLAKLGLATEAAVEAAAVKASKSTKPAAKSNNSKASMFRDSDTAKAIEKAVSSFHSALSTAFRGGKPTNPTAAAAAITKCEAKIKRVETLLASATRFADLGALRIGPDYRAIVAHIDTQPYDHVWWNSTIIDRMQHDQRYFRSMCADLYHWAAGTSWWSKGELSPYTPVEIKKKKPKRK